MMQVYDETNDDDTVFVPDRVRVRIPRRTLIGLAVAVGYCGVLGLFLWGMWKLLKGLL